jgi:WD40 repeat protein
MTALFARKHPKSPNNGPIAFHPAGDRDALGHGTKVDPWRFADRKAEAIELSGHKRPVWAAGFTPDGRTLLTAASDGTARLWDANTGASVGAFDFGIGKIYAAAFAPDGLTAAGGDKGQVVIWDVDR